MNLCKTCGTICPFDDERTECDAYAPMTNENWFISLSTEEKATFLAVNKLNFDYQMWLEWLKEKHDGE